MIQFLYERQNMQKTTRNKIIGIATIVVLLATARLNKYYTENIAPVNEAKRAVITQLNDPNSAEFYNVAVFNYYSVCGEVNAKNAMGGYVGRRRFAYSTLTHTANIEDPVLDKERLFEKLHWNVMCSGS